MATNQIYEYGSPLSLVVTHPADPNSGDPVRIGDFCGVALIDEASTKTTVATDGVYDLSVKGVNASGNSAVAVGDSIYYTDGDTPVLNKKATGTFFGYALETVGSGSTATINVRLGR